MGIEQIIGLIITLLIMGIGLIGNILPGIPASPLILIAAVAHRLYFGNDSVGNIMLVVLLLLTVFTFVLDYIATMIGAKKFGATWYGIVGAVVGGIVGLFFNIPGIILGPFIGAMLFELISGRTTDEASRAGFGAVIGIVTGTLGQIVLCVIMIILFVFNVLMRSGNSEVIEALLNSPIFPA
ncbi:MAG: DUF456 domain-containing protein [Verrucomicrobia bacterium]|nr:DUF456 domain-containing protein [Verrucomicrobiota bacterium]